MSVQELETDEGILEMRVQKKEQRKHDFFGKLINVDIDALCELYLAIICSMSINTLKLIHEKA